MDIQTKREDLKRQQRQLMVRVDELDGEIGDTLGVRDQLYYALRRIIRKYLDSTREPPVSRGCWIVVMLHMERHVDGQTSDISPFLSMPAILERMWKLKWYRHEQAHSAQAKRSEGLRLGQRWTEALRDVELPVVQHSNGTLPSTPFGYGRSTQYSYSVEYAKAAEYLRIKFREDLLQRETEPSEREVSRLQTKPTGDSHVPESLPADDIPLAAPAATPQFLRIPVELRTIIYKHFTKSRMGVQGHVYNAAIDPLPQTSTPDQFTITTKQHWDPESRAYGILGHYDILTALLCVNNVTALDKFLRKQVKALLFQAATNNRPAVSFSPPITSLRALSVDYQSGGKAAAKHAFRCLALATSLQTLTVRLDKLHWVHYRQNGKMKYNYSRQYKGLRELCDSLISLLAFRKLEIVGDCEDIAVWIGEETYKGRSDGSGGLKIGFNRFVEVSYDGAMISPKS
ncbi:hypothetical protein B0A48_11202 [Cryoendolithus antarcticus]|uniref:Uncharacterized protein n=1 Tax=Cryoendolithus antarcticus TaxID=1507870 RepID=A0A1V8SV17_9PEZI|nr:hypothetical protein B0A48_11202 [Cryoendolithus antarcticus]